MNTCTYWLLKTVENGMKPNRNKQIKLTSKHGQIVNY